MRLNKQLSGFMRMNNNYRFVNLKHTKQLKCHNYKQLKFINLKKKLKNLPSQCRT